MGTVLAGVLPLILRQFLLRLELHCAVAALELCLLVLGNVQPELPPALMLLFVLLLPVPPRLTAPRRYLVHAPLVLVEAARRREGGRAERAGEGLLTGVLPLVLRQVLLSLELLLAVAALELGLLVLGHVQPQLPPAPAAEPTVLALVLLVVLHVLVPQHRRLRRREERFSVKVERLQFIITFSTNH